MEKTSLNVRTPTSRDSASWDVVVIGAGPAGSAAAFGCAALGLRTLVVEKAIFPRDKVCGGCLSPSGMRSLQRMGLEHEVRRVAFPIGSFELFARGRCLKIPLDLQGVAIGRDVLDSMLLRHAISKGVVARLGTTARLLDAGGGCGRIELSAGDSKEELTTRSLIVADGLGGTFLPRGGHWDAPAVRGSRFGVGARLASGIAHGLCGAGTITMRCGDGGYFGAVRMSDGTVDVAAALSPRKARECGGPGNAVRRIALESGLEHDAELLALARWRGTPLLTRRRRLEAPGVFVVGDAAGYVEPFTGEGMSWGLAAGLAVAKHASAARLDRYQAGAWTREWKSLAERRRTACRAAAIGLRSPAMVAGTIALANSVPAASRLFASVVSGPWSLGGTEPAHV